MGLPEVVAVVVVGCSGEVVEVLAWAGVLEQVVFLVVVLVVVALVVESWAGMSSSSMSIHVFQGEAVHGTGDIDQSGSISSFRFPFVFFASDFFSLFFSGSSSPRWYRK